MDSETVLACGCVLTFLTVLRYLDYSHSYTGRCETMNTLISFLWWIIGFYWIFSGGEVLEHGAPRLYWYATFIFVAS
jgi:hypothetical protein